MKSFFYKWRFYSLGREEYAECMNKLFINNLYNLRQVNTIVAVFAGIYSLVPILYERDLINGAVCIATALIALLLGLYTNYKMQVTIVNDSFVYISTILFYMNIMAFSIFMGIWSNSDKQVVIFFVFLICSLLMFINPFTFNFFLTLSAIGVFVALTFVFKSEEKIAVYNTLYAVIAGVIGLYFSWQITKLRMGLELSTSLLEEERNKYLNQSTIDELTQLNNRRDFMQTFQRYLHNYRTSDDWLCVAIADIDFFKNFNDHYGHPKGDDCLRGVGAAFSKVKENMGVYTARVGGEEFAMLWFEQDATHVEAVISYFSGLIRDMNMPHEKSKVSDRVTVSIGVYVEQLGEASDVQTLYNLADKALYNAKEGGRNCAVITGRKLEQYKITPPSKK
ncbi:MAG: GGDEF domain-containing protein [Treponema sp.]|jgi:diguanylate cyclase (GGDEF)-like protein|nr:GGDEF domain-containing protein [Treponema sp.]